MATFAQEKLDKELSRGKKAAPMIAEQIILKDKPQLTPTLLNKALKAIGVESCDADPQIMRAQIAVIGAFVKQKVSFLQEINDVSPQDLVDALGDKQSPTARTIKKMVTHETARQKSALLKKSKETPAAPAAEEKNIPLQEKFAQEVKKGRKASPIAIEAMIEKGLELSPENLNKALRVINTGACDRDVERMKSQLSIIRSFANAGTSFLAEVNNKTPADIAASLYKGSNTGFALRDMVHSVTVSQRRKSRPPAPTKVLSP
jgi:hypothetical protein